METTQAVEQAALADIISRCMTDRPFRDRFKREPEAVLGEYALHVPPDLEIRVVENSDSLVHITLPAGSELTDPVFDDELHVAPCAWGMCKPKGSTGN